MMVVERLPLVETIGYDLLVILLVLPSRLFGLMAIALLLVLTLPPSDSAHYLPLLDNFYQ